jgi:ubiquinone biosynthesis UbiH/UbiF/VisC/COQ6 family hydroxylase
MLDTDITIIGAGPAGLCFARALADSGIKIKVIERQELEAISNPSYDGREIALTHFSQKLMSELGIWSLIDPEQISLIKAAKVLDGDSSYALSFDHSETVKNNLGFMISNKLIRQAAYESIKNINNIELLCQTAVKDIEIRPEKATTILEDGSTINSSLVVAADSRFSKARDIIGIDTSKYNFNRTCIVCKIRHEKDHGSTAYECFQYGRTLAILPLNNNQSSVVITIDSNKVSDITDMSGEQFSADMQKRTNGRLGKIELITQLYTYPLMATYAQKFYSKRFALIGDAAVGMHPVTAHGFNLGLQGGYTLARELIESRKIGYELGAEFPLRRYSNKHRAHTRPLYLGTNTLVRLFTKDNGPARGARKMLLRLGNNIRPAKKMILDQLTEIKEEK